MSVESLLFLLTVREGASTCPLWVLPVLSVPGAAGAPTLGPLVGFLTHVHPQVSLAPARAPLRPQGRGSGSFEGLLSLLRSAVSSCLRNSTFLIVNQWAYRVPTADPLCHPANMGSPSEPPSETS